MDTTIEWRGEFANREMNLLHAEAFGTRVFSDQEWDWCGLVAQHSLGWVVARADGRLVGFVNVVWDGLVHAWIQDTMVAEGARHEGVGIALVKAAAKAAGLASCEWLHVDFDDALSEFYIDACGFSPVRGGLMPLRGGG